MKYLIQREQEEKFHFLRIRDINNPEDIISESNNTEPNDTIFHEYDGIIYMATPDGKIYMDYDSLLSKF